MRITGGAYKRRKLFVPEGQNVRPTSDRMRQTLFNLLAHAKWAQDFNLDNAVVLDLFCGSGALGLEALSHGAAHCTFVDKNITPIKTNTAFLEDGRFDIVKSSLPNFSLSSGCFDLVFMDPPYRKGLIEPTIKNLIENQCLANDTVIVIEAEKDLKFDVPLFHLDTRMQSQSCLHIFRYKAAIEKTEKQ